jgi:hypothetical protein
MSVHSPPFALSLAETSSYVTFPWSEVLPVSPEKSGKLPDSWILEVALMPALLPSRVPSYRRHKPTGQAVVTLNGKDIYLGRWNISASKAEYNRLLGSGL